MDFNQFKSVCVEILQDAIDKAQFVPVGLIMEVPGHDKPVMMPFVTDERIMSLFNSDTGKDMLADIILPTIIQHEKATKSALILDTWVVVPKGEIDPHIPPRMNPDRVDAVVVQSLDAEGSLGLQIFEVTRDAEKQAIAVTEIKELAQQITDAGPEGKLEGRFVEGIQRALFAVKEGK